MDKVDIDNLIAKGFHHPDDFLCGACGGLLEFTRDVICYRCSPEPEVVMLQSECDAARKELLETIEKLWKATGLTEAEAWGKDLIDVIKDLRAERDRLIERLKEARELYDQECQLENKS